MDLLSGSVHACVGVIGTRKYSLYNYFASVHSRLRYLKVGFIDLLNSLTRPTSIFVILLFYYHHGSGIFVPSVGSDK